MQVSAVLMAQPLVPTEPAAPIVGDGQAWDAAMAMFGAELTQEDEPLEEMTDAVVMADLFPIEMGLTEVLPVSPVQVPTTGDETAIPESEDLVAEGIVLQVQTKPALVAPEASISERDLSSSLPLIASEPLAMVQKEPAIGPTQMPTAEPSDSPVVTIVQTAAPPLTVAPRSRAENLWEMQGLKPVAHTADGESDTASADSFILPDNPAPLAPATRDVGAPLPLAADLPLTHSRAPLPLLHHSATPQMPRLSTEFLGLVQNQAAAPPDGTITVTLSPVELGDLQLSMVRDGDQLRVAITADRPETLELLRRNTDQLGQELRDAGFASTSFSFSQGQQSQQQPDPTPSERLDDWREDIPVVRPTPARLNPTSAGLDLRI